MSKPREFFYEPDTRTKCFDALHSLLTRYDYDFTWVDDKEELDSIEGALKHIATQCPDFFDAQMELYQFYMMVGEEKKAAPCLKISYTLAQALVKDKKGNWPDLMEWSWIENRNVIRALIGGAITSWENNNTEEALEILRNILKTNPADNPGVRFLILAMREKMSYAQYQKDFETTEGSMERTVFDWFAACSKNYKEEFALHEKACAEMQ